MQVDNAAHQFRLWDVENCDTRFPNQIVLSPALNNATISPSRGDLTLLFPYINQLYFVETSGTIRAAANSFRSARVYQFAPPFTLGSYRDLGTCNPDIFEIGSINAIKPLGGQIAFVAFGGGVNIQRRLFSYSVPTIGGIVATGSILGSATSVSAQFGDFGGTPNLITYDNLKNYVQLWVGNQIGGSLSAVATRPAIVGSYLSPLISDNTTMFAQLPQGVYDFDVTPAVLIDTSRSVEMNGAMALFQNNLYFKNKKSLIKYDGTNVTSVGYDKEDGLASDKWGDITAMASTWKWLFAAVQGATYSHIYTYDGAAWEYYARVPTPGIWIKEMVLSNLPDAIDRLWCIFGNEPKPGYFLNPMVNPLQAATYSYVPTGEFTAPIYDGGLSEVPGAFYDNTLIADGIGGSNIITALYGLNGASPVTTLGVVATSPLALVYGSPYGIEGYRITPRFILAGANTGTSPIFKAAINHFLKLPSSRESFDFTIDLKETQKEQTRPLEAVLGSLNYERDIRTLIPFWYGQVATKAVKVLEMPGLEDITEDQIFEGERTGFVRVKLTEIL